MQTGYGDAFVYPVLVEAVEGGGEFLARLADIPEVLTSGATEAEAIAAAEDALEEAVLGRLANGRDVPLPSGVLGGQGVAFLAPVTAARVLVDIKRRACGWSKSQLAREMGRDEKIVRRILDGRGGVSMETALDALKALGFQTGLVWR
jgi:antitoxin HicB